MVAIGHAPRVGFILISRQLYPVCRPVTIAGFARSPEPSAPAPRSGAVAARPERQLEAVRRLGEELGAEDQGQVRIKFS